MKVRNTGAEEKIELQMTPMIDIVFQLLIFFIMTFKIVSQEAPVSNITMPLASASESAVQNDQDPLQLQLSMTADATGNLASMQIGENSFAGTKPFDDLRTYVRGFIGTDEGPGSRQDLAEVEIRADYHLRYEFIINALTAVHGYRKDNGEIKDLVTKIKFAPPKDDPEG